MSPLQLWLRQPRPKKTKKKDVKSRPLQSKVRAIRKKKMSIYKRTRKNVSMRVTYTFLFDINLTTCCCVQVAVSDRMLARQEIDMMVDAVARDMKTYSFKSLSDVNAKIAMEAVGISAQYEKLKNKMLRGLKESLLLDGSLDHLADDVPDPFHPGETIMRLFLLVGGEVNKKKVDILNKCLVNFALLQHVEANGELVQLNALLNRICALMFGMCKYGVNISLGKDLKGFHGSLNAVMTEL